MMNGYENQQEKDLLSIKLQSGTRGFSLRTFVSLFHTDEKK